MVAGGGGAEEGGGGGGGGLGRHRLQRDGRQHGRKHNPGGVCRGLLERKPWQRLKDPCTDCRGNLC